MNISKLKEIIMEALNKSEKEKLVEEFQPKEQEVFVGKPDDFIEIIRENSESD